MHGWQAAPSAPITGRPQSKQGICGVRPMAKTGGFHPSNASSSLVRRSMRPYEPLHMSTSKWMLIKPVELNIDILVPSQEEVYDNIPEGSTYCGDPIIHVVLYQGLYYISDGHHRVDRAKKKGDKTIQARLLIKD